MQRITEEFVLATQAQAVTSFDEALRRGVEQQDEEYAGLAISYLWRAVELSMSRSQSVRSHTALGAAYRARKDRDQRFERDSDKRGKDTFLGAHHGSNSPHGRLLSRLAPDRYPFKWAGEFIEGRAGA